MEESSEDEDVLSDSGKRSSCRSVRSEKDSRRRNSLSFKLTQKKRCSAQAAKKIRNDDFRDGSAVHAESSQSFEELLRRLNEEHIREVALLRGALEECEAELELGHAAVLSKVRNLRPQILKKHGLRKLSREGKGKAACTSPPQSSFGTSDDDDDYQDRVARDESLSPPPEAWRDDVIPPVHPPQAVEPMTIPQALFVEPQNQQADVAKGCIHHDQRGECKEQTVQSLLKANGQKVDAHKHEKSGEPDHGRSLAKKSGETGSKMKSLRKSLTFDAFSGVTRTSAMQEAGNMSGVAVRDRPSALGGLCAPVATVSVMPQQSLDVPASPSTKRKPVKPRIAGLKHGGSILKSEIAKRVRTSSVMFDESACDETAQPRASDNNRNSWLVRPIWQPHEEDQANQDASQHILKKRTWSFLLDTEDDDVPAPVRDDESQSSDAAALCDATETKLENRTGPQCMDAYVSHPNSTLNFYLDVASIIFICYDLVVIPLQVFNVEETTLTDCMLFTTTLFWTMDLIRHFFKGHYKQGNVVMAWKLVVCQYLRTWALLDICIVVADWLEWIVRFSEGSQSTANYSRLLRLMRNIRSLRLLRGVKTGHILKMIEDRIHSEALGVVWTTVKLLIMILFANHLSACVWFWLGGVNDNQPNWHDQYLETHPLGSTIMYQYLTSFHWAITQFTPASIAVQPENSLERLYAIFILLCAFVTMSTFISGLTSAVMQLRQLSSDRHKQFWRLRRYLNEAGVPTKLAVRINNYCEHTWSVRGKRLLEKDIELLMLLSRNLRAELRSGIFGPRLTQHAFFMLLQVVAPSSIRSICGAAVTQNDLSRGDDLFMCGEDAHHMFFVDKGDVVYKPYDDVGGGELVTVSWVCEVCLWTVWVYRGTLTANCDHSLAFAVDADSFGKVVKISPEARPEALAYAKSFMNGINREPLWRLNDLYNSGQTEGLWFRLLKDFHVSKSASMVWTDLPRRRQNQSGTYRINYVSVYISALWSGIVESCLNSGLKRVFSK